MRWAICKRGVLYIQVGPNPQCFPTVSAKFLFGRNGYIKVSLKSVSVSVKIQRLYVRNDKTSSASDCAKKQNVTWTCSWLRIWYLVRYIGYIGHSHFNFKQSYKHSHPVSELHSIPGQYFVPVTYFSKKITSRSFELVLLGPRSVFSSDLAGGSWSGDLLNASVTREPPIVLGQLVPSERFLAACLALTSPVNKSRVSDTRLQLPVTSPWPDRRYFEHQKKSNESILLFCFARMHHHQ